MATVKNGILTSAHEWWVHLRPYGKRDFWHRERKASQRDVDLRVEEVDAVNSIDREIDFMADHFPRHRRDYIVVATVSIVSLVSVALAERMADDLPHGPWDKPALIDAHGHSACEPGYLHYRGWCHFDRDAYARAFGPDVFHYPMSEFVPPGAVSATWNASGSAVCPNNADYIAREGYCLPRG